jgi:hypothetical protein
MEDSSEFIHERDLTLTAEIYFRKFKSEMEQVMMATLKMMMMMKFKLVSQEGWEQSGHNVLLAALICGECGNRGKRQLAKSIQKASLGTGTPVTRLDRLISIVIYRYI